MTHVPSHERANLWVVCAAQFICLAGMTAVIPLIPLYLQQIGIEDRESLRYWTGGLTAAPFVLALVATPLWGALADRIGHKPMVIRSVVGIAIATCGMGFSDSPVELLGWRAVQGAVSGVFPAAVGLLTSLTPEERVGRALAIFQATRSAATLTGPLVGGLLADVLGITPLFFGVGAGAIATAGVCAVVLDEPRKRGRSRTPEPGVRWTDLVRNPPVLGMLLVVLLYQVTVMASWPTLALFVESLGVEPDSIASVTGLVMFAQGLPSMLLATTWVGFVPRFGLERIIAMALAASAVTNVLVGLASEVEVVLALRLLSGVAMAGFVPLTFQWLNGHAPENARGRMAGISSTAMMLGNVLGSLFGGWLSVEFGLSATFWAPGILLGVTAIVFAVTTRRRS